MKHLYLIALSIFVLSISQGDALSLGSILGLGGNETSGEDDDGPIPTKISKVEEVVKTILTSMKAINNVSNFIPQIPRKLRDQIESSFNKGKQRFSDVLNLFPDKFQAIYPGTLWCGAGDIAKNDTDLGLFKSTDACCRDHDKCFSNIDADSVKDGLWNTGIFTRSHCSCDHAFYNCLKNADSIVATKIGFTYFDILKPQCFADNEYSNGNVTDDSSGKSNDDLIEGNRYQWFDNPKF